MDTTSMTCNTRFTGNTTTTGDTCDQNAHHLQSRMAADDVGMGDGLAIESLSLQSHNQELNDLSWNTASIS